MTQPFRFGDGLIDRSRTFNFRFNEKPMQGHPGDTLASALLANGQRLVGRSFKYHRPRGIFSSGSEEPNALVQLRRGAAREPNTRATVAELYEDLEATSQNHRGPLGFDFMAINDLMAPFLSAGFYYKTFMWPAAFWEKLYEPVIRASAGLGKLSGEPDPDVYDHGYLHCDILIVGAGPSGLSAALTAARAGARVILADEDFRPGGRLNAETFEIAGLAGHAWAQHAWAELSALENVRLLPRTTVFGAYDHGIYGALERVTDHLKTSGGKPRQILWRLYSRQAILCAGATERPVAFANNDRPGIMLAGAVRTFANRFGVAAGKRISVFTNNDDGWRSARDLAAAGQNIVAVIDSRPDVSHSIAGIRSISGHTVIDTRGRKALRYVTLSDGSLIDTDCLAVSGGWSPNVHLTCHHRGRPIWKDEIAALVPGPDLPRGMRVAGAANGTLTLREVLREGAAVATNVLSDLGIHSAPVIVPEAEDEAASITGIWQTGNSKTRAWVDLQNDVTTKDVEQAVQEGFRSVEHLKRYTTLGMATDQGRTSGVLGLAVLAEATGRSIPDTGTTVFRPPYTPVPIGAFAGRSRGKEFRAARLTSTHAWAQETGASFTESGQWLRAEWYTRPGEAGWRDSVDREVRMTRDSVGICDVSTLGKIDIQGRNAAEFLNRIYSNDFAKLPVGRIRYGLMLREDGFLYDDGTTARLGETHFVMTTTTANAGLVFRNLEFARQCLWPGLDVHLISTTDAWAQFAVAGPNSRNLLTNIVDPAHDISAGVFPFMACAELAVCGGIPARLFRISFSGELAYELAVPARHGDSLIRVLMSAGAEFDAVPYGVEALNVMRIEKGHVTGAEITGQTTAEDLGLGKMTSKAKDYVGRVLSERPAMSGENSLQLMGFRPVDRSQTLEAGAHFLGIGAPSDIENDQGWMTSVAWSPTLGHAIGLGMIRRGRERIGEVVRAADPLRGKEIRVEIVAAQFVDPEGGRQRG